MVIIVIILLAFATYFYWQSKKAPVIKANEIKKSVSIDYPSKYNFRQTVLHCGPFSVSAVIRAVKKEEADSAEVVSGMKWRIPRMGYHPWGLERALKEKGVQVETPYLNSLTDEQRIQFLKAHLSQQRPIILLGEKNGVQHYMTLLGFDSNQDEFYFYDSWYNKADLGLTEDDNGDLPGNRTLNTAELLDFWNKGGVLGFYKWYAIVTSV